MLRKSSIGYEMKKKRELKVLFVSKRDCCRAPMADCIFQYLAEKYSIRPFCRFLWRSQSAGFESYNQGNLPEQMCLRVLKENNLDTMHGCRQVSFNRLTLNFFIVHDFERAKFFYIFAAKAIWLQSLRLYSLHGTITVSCDLSIENPFE